MSFAVGIDIGNDKCIVAVSHLHDGTVDEAPKEESIWKTPSVIHFASNHRLFGSAGASASTANPKSAISQLKRIIGRCYDEEGIQDELKRLPYETCRSADGGISVKVRYRDKDCVFTAIEMMAMLMSYLKRETEKKLGTSFENCVIGVPSYFTNLQRKAYLDAARIAGLKPLRLFHDGAAIALSHGTVKKLDEGAENHVVYVDIGHYDTQVTVVRFDRGGMRVLSHAFDQDTGGRDFDLVIFENFVEMFENVHQIDIRSNEKARARLMVACEKAKKDLSFNKEAFVSIECLVGDTDLEGSITKRQFEERSLDLFQRILRVCRKGLEDAGLDREVRATTYSWWGSVRVFQRFRSVSLSRGYSGRMRSRCLMRTTNGSHVDVHSSVRCWTHFSRSKAFRTYIVDDYSEPFIIEVGYSDLQALPPGVLKYISKFKVMFVDEAGRYGIKIQLDIHGIFTLELVSRNDYKNAQILKGVHQTLVVHNEMGCLLNALIDASNVGFIYENSDHKYPKHESMMRLKIDIEEFTIGGGAVDFHKAKINEILMNLQDEKVQLAKEKMSTLEAYIYDIRNNLQTNYKRVATKSEKTTILGRLTDIEEWLYECGDKEFRESYESILIELRLLIQPIENRYNKRKALEYSTKDEFSELLKHCMFANEVEENGISLRLNEIEECVYVHGDDSEIEHKSKIEKLKLELDRIRKCHWEKEIKHVMQRFGNIRKELHSHKMMANEEDLNEYFRRLEEVQELRFLGVVDSERVFSTKVKDLISFVDSIECQYRKSIEHEKAKQQAVGVICNAKEMLQKPIMFLNKDEKKDFERRLKEIRSRPNGDGGDTEFNTKIKNLDTFIDFTKARKSAVDHFEAIFPKLPSTDQLFWNDPNEVSVSKLQSKLQQIKGWQYVDGCEIAFNNATEDLEKVMVDWMEKKSEIATADINLYEKFMNNGEQEECRGLCRQMWKNALSSDKFSAFIDAYQQFEKIKLSVQERIWEAGVRNAQLSRK